MLSLKAQDNETIIEKVYAHFDIDSDDAFAEEKLQTAMLELERVKIEQQRVEKDMARLQHYMDQLTHDMIAVQHSRAWKVGFLLMSLAKKLLGRKRGGDGFERINQTTELYEHWKKARD